MTACTKIAAANNALDFDDLLLKTLTVPHFPEVLTVRHARHIHVDEYQDTNLAQYIAGAVVLCTNNICVVGTTTSPFTAGAGRTFETF